MCFFDTTSIHIFGLFLSFLHWSLQSFSFHVLPFLFPLGYCFFVLVHLFLFVPSPKFSYFSAKIYLVSIILHVYPHKFVINFIYIYDYAASKGYVYPFVVVTDLLLSYSSHIYQPKSEYSIIRNCG